MGEFTIHVEGRGVWVLGLGGFGGLGRMCVWCVCVGGALGIWCLFWEDQDKSSISELLIEFRQMNRGRRAILIIGDSTVAYPVGKKRDISRKALEEQVRNEKEDKSLI